MNRPTGVILIAFAVKTVKVHCGSLTNCCSDGTVLWSGMAAYGIGAKERY